MKDEISLKQNLYIEDIFFNGSVNKISEENRILFLKKTVGKSPFSIEPNFDI